MVAIGFNTDTVKLIKTRGEPIVMEACCWGNCCRESVDTALNGKLAEHAKGRFDLI